jgi:hypothetical protein
VSWLLHGVVHCALESQTGVSGNRAAHHSGFRIRCLLLILCIQQRSKVRGEQHGCESYSAPGDELIGIVSKTW